MQLLDGTLLDFIHRGTAHSAVYDVEPLFIVEQFLGRKATYFEQFKIILVLSIDSTF